MEVIPCKWSFTVKITYFTLFLGSLLTFNAQASYWNTLKKGFSYAQGLFSRAQTGSTMQKRSLLKATDLKGLDSCIKDKYKHLSPTVGAGMMSIINNLYNHGNPHSATTQLINNPKFGLFHKNDHGVAPTKHKSLPGASLNPTLAATLIGHLETDRLQDEKIQKNIIHQWKQTHKDTFGSSANLTTGRIQEFLQTLIQAKKEAQDTPEQAATFPHYYPYGIVTSLLWQNATQKKEMVDYLSATQKLVPLLDQAKDFFLSLPEQQKSRLDEETAFTVEELNENKNWQDIQNNFEKNIATEIYLRDNSSPIPGNVRDDYYGFKNFKPVPTCAEAALRDICNLILADNNQQFNIALLPESIKPLETFVHFYQEHPTFFTINDNKVGQTWMNTVSGHTRITYCQNNNDTQNAYEIDPPLKNLLCTLNVFFGTIAHSFEELGTQLSSKEQHISCKEIDNNQINFTITKPNKTIISAQLCANSHHAWLDVPMRKDGSRQRINITAITDKNIQPLSMQANQIITQRLSRDNAINYLSMPSCLAQLNHLAYSSKNWSDHKKWYNNFSLLEKKACEAENYLCNTIINWSQNNLIEVHPGMSPHLKKEMLIDKGFIFKGNQNNKNFVFEITPIAFLRWASSCIKFGEDIITDTYISPFNDLNESNVTTCIAMLKKRLANDNNKVKEAIVHFFNLHDINKVDPKTGGPIIRLLEVWNCPELVNILLDCKPNINVICPRSSMTPLNTLICSSGSYDYLNIDYLNMAKKIINLGADVNLATKNDFGSTRAPLHNASKFGYLDIVQELLKAGAHVNASDNKGDTPLHFASEQGHTEAIQILLDCGADINAANHKGETPLNLAIEHNNLEIIQMLLDYGADVNTNDFLWEASERGDLKVVKMLLKAGAHVNGSSNETVTPLWVASSLGRLDAVEALLQADADVNIPDDASGQSPLNIAFLHGHIDVAHTLLKRNGIHVNTASYHGETALHQAIAYRHIENQLDIIQKIISHGADLSLQNHRGLTPLQLAEKVGNQEIIQYLQDIIPYVTDKQDT